MFRLATERLTPGMILARSIYESSGGLLLDADAIMDEQAISRLAGLGIKSVYVRNQQANGQPATTLPEQTQAEIRQLAGRIFDNFCRTQNTQLASLGGLVDRVVEAAVMSRGMLSPLSVLRLHDDYTFSHSVSVCVLSVLIGAKMQLPEKELVELAMGALLHDLGKLMIPRETLNKKAPLSAAEWQFVRGHGHWAYEMLRRRRGLPPVAALIARQHHENFDGSGYPLNLTGGEIHRYARIVAVADVFDAVTTDRPYRKSFLPHDAYEAIIGGRGSKFDPFVVDVFIASVVLYPIGSTVVFDSGEVGLVVKVYPKLPTRPLVKVIFDKDGKPSPGPGRLISMPDAQSIVRVIGPEEICGCD